MLTKEQQNLIADYLSNKGGYKQIKSAVYNVLKRPMSDEEMEDLIGQAHIALCKAAKNYNTDKGMSFSTYVYMNVCSSVKSYLREKGRVKRKAIAPDVSLDDVYVNELPSYTNIDEGMESEVVDKVNKILTNFERKVLHYLMLGYSEKAISKKLHVKLDRVKAVRNFRFLQFDVLSIISEIKNREEDN